MLTFYMFFLMLLSLNQGLLSSDEKQVTPKQQKMTADQRADRRKRLANILDDCNEDLESYQRLIKSCDDEKKKATFAAEIDSLSKKKVFCTTQLARFDADKEEKSKSSGQRSSNSERKHPLKPKDVTDLTDQPPLDDDKNYLASVKVDVPTYDEFELK